MKKNVCMFVWNHFTNDARVLRECTALAESGYNVDLICIHDPKDKNMMYYEERSERFHIYRVKRYPSLLIYLQTIYKKMFKNKAVAGVSILFWLLMIFFQPLLMVPLTLVLFLVLKTKIKGMTIKGSIILRMILRGFSKKYDIYHSNDLNTLPQGYISAKWRFNKKPLIYDSHEVQTSRTGYNSPIYGLLERFLIPKIDSMIVENHTRAKYNEKLYGFYPKVVHNYPFKTQINYTEKVNIHELLDLSVEEKILLYQGGIQTGRGLDKLIKAVPFINEGTLVLIGDGKIKPDLQKLVFQMGLEERVKFIPKVPLKELSKYTSNAYLGFQVLNNVCFNHYSASSNKLFEYIMAGVPVVACDFPEIKRVVEGENIGLCIDSHNSEEIAEAVNELVTNKQLYTELTANTFIASENYNWDEEKHHFITIYKEI